MEKILLIVLVLALPMGLKAQLSISWTDRTGRTEKYDSNTEKIEIAKVRKAPKSSRNFQKSDLVAWKTLKIKNLLFQSRLTAG